jgi:hypothetical protein
MSWQAAQRELRQPGVGLGSRDMQRNRRRNNLN